MATTRASYRNPEPQSPTFVERAHNYPETRADTQSVKTVKFDSDFLERRLQAHADWQAQQAADLATGIILEVAIALEEIA